jgi:hypothetical protein
MLEVDMDEADGGVLEHADGRLVRLGALAQAVALQAAMDGAAGQLAVEAAPHHFDDIVERQLQMGTQFADQRLLQRRQLGRQPLGRVRAVGDGGPPAPAADRGLADAQFGGQLGDRLPAALDVGPDLRRGGGIGVQVQFHDARRSLT